MPIITDTGFVLLVLAIFSGWGLPVAAALGNRSALLLAPGIGLALTAVVSVPLLRLGLSPQHIGWILFVGLLLGGTGGALAIGAQGLPMRLHRRTFALAIVTLAATGTLLMLPHWTMGLQYGIFLGNHWDQFLYESAAASLITTPAPVLAAAPVPADALGALSEYGQWGLANRTAIITLYASVVAASGSSVALAGTTWLIAVLLCSVPSLWYIVVKLFPRAPLSAALLTPLGFVLGFWGQYTLDINSWGQISVLAPGLAATGIIFGAATGASTPQYQSGASGRYIPWPEVITLAVLFAGGLALYPEGFGLLVCSALIGTLVRLLVERRRGTAGGALADVGRLVLPAATVAAVFLASEAAYLLRLAESMAAQATTTLNWWQYFQAFLLGQDLWYREVFALFIGEQGATLAPVEGLAYLVSTQTPAFIAVHLLALIPNFTLGIAGLFFLTPPDLSDASGFVTFVIVTAAATAVAWAVSQIIAADDQGIRALSWSILIGLLVSAIFLLRGEIWTAGKALAFMSPLVCLLLVAPLLTPDAFRNRVAPLIVATIWLILQFTFYGSRVISVHLQSGIPHNSPPYVGIQREELKTRINWNSLRLMDTREDCSHAVISFPQAEWLERAVIMRLVEKSIPFTIGAPPGDITESMSIAPNSENSAHVTCLYTSSRDNRGAQSLVVIPQPADGPREQ